jgi:hypothetical protein
MKTSIFRNILWLLPLILVQLSVSAQDAAKDVQAPKDTKNEKKKSSQKKKKTVVPGPRYAIDFDAGYAYPINTQLSSAFTGGLDASLGFKVAFLKKKLWVRPEGGIQYYTKKADIGESMQEVNRDWKAGVELQYKAYEVKKFSFFPVLRADYNWFSNQFSKQLNDETTNSQIIATGENLLTANTYSIAAGIMVMRSGFMYVKIDYEYFKPTLTVNPNLVKAMLAQGFIMADKQTMDLSTANLKIGFNLNFKH